jgi:hypothetical protein
MTIHELEELLTRLGKERRSEGVKAWYEAQVQQRRN